MPSAASGATGGNCLGHHRPDIPAEINALRGTQVSRVPAVWPPPCSAVLQIGQPTPAPRLLWAALLRAHWEIWRGIRDDLDISQLPHGRSHHPVRDKLVLPAQDPYLGLLPKQFVLGGWCLPSVAAAMLLGSRPGSWDPEWVKKKRVKKLLKHLRVLPSFLPSLLPERRPRSYRTDPPSHKDPALTLRCSPLPLLHDGIAHPHSTPQLLAQHQGR